MQQELSGLKVNPCGRLGPSIHKQLFLCSIFVPANVRFAVFPPHRKSALDDTAKEDHSGKASGSVEMQASRPANGPVRHLQLPVINLLQSGPDEDIGAALVDACAKYGFVFVRGEGLGFSSETLDDAFELVRACHLRRVGAFAITKK